MDTPVSVCSSDPTTTPRLGSKLDSLTREELIGFLKKQQLGLQQLKKKCEGLSKEKLSLEEKLQTGSKSEPNDGALQEENAALKAKLDAALQQCSEAQEYRDALEAQCEAATKRSARLEQQLDEVESESADGASVLKDLRRRLIDLEDELATLSEENHELRMRQETDAAEAKEICENEHVQQIAKLQANFQAQQQTLQELQDALKMKGEELKRIIVEKNEDEKRLVEMNEEFKELEQRDKVQIQELQAALKMKDEEAQRFMKQNEEVETNLLKIEELQDALKMKDEEMKEFVLQRKEDEKRLADLNAAMKQNENVEIHLQKIEELQEALIMKEEEMKEFVLQRKEDEKRLADLNEAMKQSEDVEIHLKKIEELQEALIMKEEEMKEFVLQRKEDENRLADLNAAMKQNEDVEIHLQKIEELQEALVVKEEEMKEFVLQRKEDENRLADLSAAMKKFEENDELEISKQKVEELNEILKMKDEEVKRMTMQKSEDERRLAELNDALKRLDKNDEAPKIPSSDWAEGGWGSFDALEQDRTAEVAASQADCEPVRAETTRLRAKLAYAVEELDRVGQQLEKMEMDNKEKLKSAPNSGEFQQTLDQLKAEKDRLTVENESWISKETELTNQLTEQQKLVDRLTRDVNQYETAELELRELFSSLRDECDETMRQLEAVSAEKQELQAKCEQLRENCEQLQSVEQSADVSAQLKDEVARLREKNTELAEKINSLNCECDETKKQLESVVTEKKELAENCAQMEARLQAVDSSISDDVSPHFEEEIARLKAENKEFENRTAEMNVELGRRKEEITKLQESLEQSQTAEIELNEMIGQLEREKEKLKTQAETGDKKVGSEAESERVKLLLKDKESDIEDLTGQLQLLGHQLKVVEREKDDISAKLKSEIEKCRVLQEKLHVAEDENQLLMQKTDDEAAAHKATTDLLEKTKLQLKEAQEATHHSAVWNLEIADYERSISNLQQQLTDRQSSIEKLEKLSNARLTEITALKKEIADLKSQAEKSEGNIKKLKILAMKSKKESEQHKLEIEEKVVEMNAYQAKLRDATDEVERLKMEISSSVSEAHQSESQLQSNLTTANAELQKANLRCEKLGEDAKLSAMRLKHLEEEHQAYKVKVQHILKQQREKPEDEAWAFERAHLTKTVELVQDKLRETTTALNQVKNDYTSLQEDHDTLLHKYQEMRHQTESQEKSLRTQMEQVSSNSNLQISQQTDTIKMLTQQNETMRKEFEDRTKALKRAHQQSTEEFEQRITSLENLLHECRSNKDVNSDPENQSGGRSNKPLALHIPEHSMIPPLSERHPGVGSESTDTPKASPPYTPSLLSLDDLITSDASKLSQTVSPRLEDYQRNMEQLAQSVRRIQHLNEVLNESEANNARLGEQVKVLKEEIRRLERNEERKEHVANAEYLKNVIMKFFTLRNGEERLRLIPVMQTMLRLSPEEVNSLTTLVTADGSVPASGTGSSGWTGYLHRWS